MDDAQFGDRVSQIVESGMASLSLALGNKLRLFDALATGSREKGLDSTTLAERLSLKERFVREWLGSVVTAKLVDVADEEDKFYLSQEKAKHLCYDSGNSAALFSWIIPICGGVFEDVCHAFQKDGPIGVPYSRYPAFHDWRHNLTQFSFPTFVEKSLLPSCPGLWDRASKEGITVCEIGCSEGTMAAILANKFPKSHFWASDIGKEEIENANKMKQKKGLKNVTYEVQDGTKLPAEWTGKFDAVVVYDVIHDLGRPDVVVKELHRVMKEGGTALIMENDFHDRMLDNVDAPDAVLSYGISLFHCLPVSLHQGPDSWGLGAAWGRGKAAKLFRECGFRSVESKGFECGNSQAVFVCVK